MDVLYEKVDDLGDAILTWADPNGEFGGYTKGWPFTDFRTAFTISTGYILFVIFGTRAMKSGIPALDPYPIKFFYNVSQIMLCAYMTLEAFFLAYRNYGTCMPCVPYNAENPPVANLLWLFYASKIWDFWDTAFIIMGKKWRQLSFLHVYHHWSIFLFYWLNVNVLYDGDIYLTVLLNGFIHTVMYTYYFICMHTKDPKTGKSLPIWWKSSLTMLQLVQFVVMMSQGAYVTISGCMNSRVASAYVGYIFSLFLLFMHFYIQSYVKPKKTKTI